MAARHRGGSVASIVSISSGSGAAMAAGSINVAAYQQASMAA